MRIRMGALVCLLACNSSPGDVDAGADAALSDASFTDVHEVDPDACASCESLTALCASDASTALPCPPPLDSPDFDAWARLRFSKEFAPLGLGCASPKDCSETVMVSSNNGVDCWLEYIFDSSTKKLVGIAEACNGHVGCIASDGCLPLRCMNDGGASFFASSSCPPMPDSGPLDASSD